MQASVLNYTSINTCTFSLAFNRTVQFTQQPRSTFSPLHSTMKHTQVLLCLDSNVFTDSRDLICQIHAIGCKCGVTVVQNCRMLYGSRQTVQTEGEVDICCMKWKLCETFLKHIDCYSNLLTVQLARYFQ